jgi:hypothetical protein
MAREHVPDGPPRKGGVRFAGSCDDVEKVNLESAVRIVVRHDGSASDDADLQSRLLVALADDGVGRRLLKLALTPGKFVSPTQHRIVSASPHQKLSLAPNQSDRNDIRLHA